MVRVVTGLAPPTGRGTRHGEENTMADGFTLVFTGDQEVPPNGSAASGAGTVAWDGAARTAAYEYTVEGVDFGPVLGLGPQTETTADDVTIMHVHNEIGRAHV